MTLKNPIFRNILICYPFTNQLKHIMRSVKQHNFYSPYELHLVNKVICCISLQDPQQSAYMHLYNSNQDDSLITLTGFTHNAFNKL